jgi:hypothetical protein
MFRQTWVCRTAALQLIGGSTQVANIIVLAARQRPFGTEHIPYRTPALVQNLYPRGHPETATLDLMVQQLATPAAETPSGHSSDTTSAAFLHRLRHRLLPILKQFV